jgi:hypothetical protein
VTLDEVVAQLKKDPGRPVRARVGELTIEVPAVGEQEAAGSAADVFSELGPWAGESTEEILRLLAEARRRGGQRKPDRVALQPNLQPDTTTLLLVDRLAASREDPSGDARCSSSWVRFLARGQERLSDEAGRHPEAFSQQLIQQRAYFGDQPLSLGSEQDAERSDHPEAEGPGGAARRPFVDEEIVRVELHRQAESLALSRPQARTKHKRSDCLRQRPAAG